MFYYQCTHCQKYTYNQYPICGHYGCPYCVVGGPLVQTTCPKAIVRLPLSRYGQAPLLSTLPPAQPTTDITSPSNFVPLPSMAMASGVNTDLGIQIPEWFWERTDLDDFTQNPSPISSSMLSPQSPSPILRSVPSPVSPSFNFDPAVTPDPTLIPVKSNPTSPRKRLRFKVLDINTIAPVFPPVIVVDGCLFDPGWNRFGTDSLNRRHPNHLSILNYQELLILLQQRITTVSPVNDASQGLLALYIQEKNAQINGEVRILKGIHYETVSSGHNTGLHLTIRICDRIKGRKWITYHVYLDPYFDNHLSEITRANICNINFLSISV